MDDRIAPQRNRAMARDSPGDEPNRMGDLLGRRHRRETDFIACPDDAASLSQAELRLDLRPVLLDHEGYPVWPSTLFARFGEEDHIPIELHTPPLQLEDRHQAGGDAQLVIDR